MNGLLRHIALAALLAIVIPALASAEVSRVAITARRDVAGGRSFGAAGSYERMSGKVYFLVDPGSRRNQVIADLDKAAKNAAGKIEMSADLVIFRPRDPSRGNGIALFDIVNRGATVALNNFNGPTTNTPEGEVGDGFLLARGYTIVQVGWEFDARREGAVRIDLPGAAGVTGLVRATFIPNNRNATTVGDLAGYTPSDPASPKNTLSVRNALGAQWTAIPRAKWQLSGNTVTLEGGFEPGHTYELAYVAENPPIAGLGFAAVRDAAAWVKYASDAAVSAKYTFAFGSSQTGRWLRDFLYEGFNTDERGRQVFDAVIPHKGGAGGVVLDVRWSTPTSLLMETATHFPFSDRKQRDPVTGIAEGLLENARASEHQPKIFYTYTDTEYWERSVALTHLTPDGSKDVAQPDNVRLYHLPKQSLADLAAAIKEKLKVRAIRVIGDPQTPVSTVAFNPGSTPINMVQRTFSGNDVDVLVCGEPGEWDSGEYVRDAVAAGKKKGMIVLGHDMSEEGGMAECARWLKTIVTEVPVEFMPAGEAFWTPRG